MQANQVNYASSLNSASSIQPSRSQTDGVLTEVRCQIDGASENIANMAFRVEQLGERLFGAIPASDDEKTPGVPHPVSGHVDAIQHGLMSLKNQLSRLESALSRVEKIG